MTIPRGLALRIIEQLRSGSNLLEGVSLFSAGRQVLFEVAEESLSELEISNGSAVRWIRGNPGQGKTHFFARLMDMGFRRNWLVSYVQISAKGEGRELHRFDEIYSGIISNCLCSAMVCNEGGRVQPGRVSGWTWVLDDWFMGIRRLAGGSESAEISSFRLRDVIEQTMTGLKRKYSLHGSFAEALRQYALAKADSDEDHASLLRDWFHGVDVHSRGADVRKRLKSVGILESVSRKNAKEMLRTLSAFLAYRNFGGFLLLLDEVENVLGQSTSNRRSAYTILRELIDNVDERHGMLRTAFYIAATPDFFDSETGVTEHEALASRVLPPSRGLGPNPAGSIVDLAAFPFAKQDYLQIAERITVLYELAKNWQCPADLQKGLVGTLDESLRSNPQLTVRQWVKAVVGTLDQLRIEVR